MYHREYDVPYDRLRDGEKKRCSVKCKIRKDAQCDIKKKISQQMSPKETA